MDHRQREHLKNFLVRQAEACEQLQGLMHDLDEAGCNYDYLVCAKSLKRLTNAQIQVMRNFNGYSEKDVK